MPQTSVTVGSQIRGVVVFKATFAGTSNSTYPMKYSVRPVRYWSPAVRFVNVFLPLAGSQGLTHSCRDRLPSLPDERCRLYRKRRVSPTMTAACNYNGRHVSVPLLRSRNDKKYNTVSPGTTRKSNLRSRAFSLIHVALTLWFFSTELESDLGSFVSSAEYVWGSFWDSCFSGMVVIATVVCGLFLPLRLYVTARVVRNRRD